MTRLLRTVIASHAAAFAVGFVVGKSVNADELELYREANESTVMRIKRKVATVGLGIAAIGTVALIVRIGTMGRGGDRSASAPPTTARY